MELEDDVIARVCAAVPSATPALVRAVAGALLTSGGQIVFEQGEGQEVAEGKSAYPDYLQLVIHDAHKAALLAGELSSACASRRLPVTLFVAGKAELSD